MRTSLAPALFLLSFAFLACTDTAISGGEEGAPVEKVATFAGGCFWCMESPFEKLDGVKEVLSGYTGGSEKDPTYKEVSSGRTGHAESIQVKYDPSRVSYRKLLEVFWRQIDPTDGGGQFADRGDHYRTAIFFHDEEQRRLAETSKAELAKSGRFEKPIVTGIVPAGRFYAAEDYHQDFYKTNPERYRSYRVGSGRAGFLEKTWGGDSAASSGKRYPRPPDEELRKRLTPLQYRVAREAGTEPPFKNEYWDNKREGIYVDIVSGEPLFSSTDKFVSGTGWPSFTRPLEPGHIVKREDTKLGYARGELRSRDGDSHLGHVFPDGPKPTGLRYCVNSAALRFIPNEQLEKEGYGQYLHLFRKPDRGG